MGLSVMNMLGLYQVYISHIQYAFENSFYIIYSTSSLVIPGFTKVKVKVTLRLTVSQSFSLGVEFILRFMTRYLLLSDSFGLAFLGRPL
jgi:hypothetical protein